MTDEEIFDLADKYGSYDDFGRWQFHPDRLISFALSVIQSEHKAVLDTIDELTGMEADRNAMFSDGYDHALSHIKEFVEARGMKQGGA